MANDSEMLIVVTCEVIYCNVSFILILNTQCSGVSIINGFQKTHFTTKIYCIFSYFVLDVEFKISDFIKSTFCCTSVFQQ